jgi:putative transposase
VIVQKAFKFRFFPTDEQAAQLANTFGCARYVYNQALELRTTAWQQVKKSIGYHNTAAKLTEWKTALSVGIPAITRERLAAGECQDML